MPWPYECIVEYPVNPDHLPAGVREHAYDDCPPLHRTVRNLAVAVTRIPLRSSSELPELAECTDSFVF